MTEPTVQFRVRQVPSGTPGALELYGAAQELWDYQGPEAIIAGPYETGKTYSALLKLHYILSFNPDIRALMVRGVYKALLTSAWRTYADKILPYPPHDKRCPVRVVGGTKPSMVVYPNGSLLLIGGLDLSSNLLSSEYDYVYVNQAEEVTLDTWETLIRCTTGRAGNTEWPQLFADCNPDTEHHWIVNRPACEVFYSVHEDNPVLFDHRKNQWTDQGLQTLTRLDSMTGMRYKRGRLGLWCSGEGMVYEDFDPSIHVIDSFEIPRHWPRYRSFDFGMKHPFVCQWWTADPEDRLYMYREVYHTGRTVDEHLAGKRGYPGILALSEGEEYAESVADWDAENTAQLRLAGIDTRPADKRIRVGIQNVQERLKFDGGKPRIFFFRDALVEPDTALKEKFMPLNTEQEISGYVWRKVVTGREAKARDEIPVQANDHGMDAMRYMVMYFDGGLRYGPPTSSRYA